MKKLKKILLPLVTAILVIAISIGATLAYLTDVDSETNVMTIGKVDIELLEYERINTETKDADANVQEFHDNKPLLPAVIEKGFDYTTGDTYVDWTQDAVEWQQQNDDDGYTSPIWDPAKISNEVDKMVFLKNSGDYGAYVRIYFAFEAGNFDTFNEFREMIHLNLNETGDWKWEWIPFLATNDEGGKYFIANATYKNELLPDDFTDITLSQIALDSTADNDDVSAFGDTYEVFVNAQGIQSAGFKDPDTALDEGFGDEIPFKDLTFETGVKLKTALHYLNGEESEDKKITANVSTVTFGLNKDHKNITSKYNPTFIDSEQDVAVYSYYVKNDAGKYDIYVLADSKIYTPKDSTNLFRGMTSLTKVDTSNMDVSRTEIMKNMFRECSALTDLNVSNWNTSTVTDMTSMFSDCYKLVSVNVSEWNVGNVTNMNYAFYGCKALTSLNVSKWNVSRVTEMYAMFYECSKLSDINVSGWKVDNVTTMFGMFDGCAAVQVLDVSNWNVINLKNANKLFSRCAALTTLNMKSWNTSNITDMGAMFDGCLKLKTIFVGAGWNMDNVTTSKSNQMFRDCNDLVGGKGTAYDANKTNKDYARIDNPPEAPGYLTHIDDKPAESEQN